MGKQKSLFQQYADDCQKAGTKPNPEILKELLRVEYLNSPAKKKIDSLMGKTIMSIDYDGTESGAIEFTFTDQTTLYIDANGDECAHTEIVLNAERI